MKKIKLVLFLTICFVFNINSSLAVGGNELENRLVEYNNEYKELYVDKIFPVGTVYITVKNENPGETIGGIWERYAEGRTLVGVGSNGGKSFNAGDKGGNYNLVATTTQSDGFYLYSSNITVSKMASNFTNLAPYTTAYIWERIS